MTNQSDRQASVRAVTGTAWTYEGDWHALFDLMGIAVNTFDCRMLAWINGELGTSYTELNGAMQAYAVSQGAPNWAGLGTFSPLGALFAGAAGFWFDFTTGATGAGIASVTSYPPGTATAAQATGSSQPNWNAGGWATFDGNDDELLSTLNPANAVTIILCARITTPGATVIPMGSQLAASGRIRFGMLSTGVIAGAVGATTETTITSGVNVGGADMVALLRVNGSAYDLQVNGVSKITGTASGAPNTTIPFMLGCNNSNGAAGGFAGGRIYRAAAIQRYIPDTLVLAAQRMAARNIVTI